jgi:hypothetical protein
MSKIKFYQQCLIVKTINNKRFELISWIRDDHAIIGKELKLETETGWDEGWVVEKRYTKMKAEDVEKSERDFYKWRKHTDV